MLTLKTKKETPTSKEIELLTFPKLTDSEFLFLYIYLFDISVFAWSDSPSWSKIQWNFSLLQLIIEFWEGWGIFNAACGFEGIASGLIYKYTD